MLGIRLDFDQGIDAIGASRDGRRRLWNNLMIVRMIWWAHKDSNLGPAD
jgi:hypothetical protein